MNDIPARSPTDSNSIPSVAGFNQTLQTKQFVRDLYKFLGLQFKINICFTTKTCSSNQVTECENVLNTHSSVSFNFHLNSSEKTWFVQNDAPENY